MPALTGQAAVDSDQKYYGFPSDCVLLVVQGKENLGGVLKMTSWGTSW